MKIYILEYELEIIKLNSFENEIEHRIETFTDISKFIKTTKEKTDKYYIFNVKTYVAEAKEIDINKVINPF